MNILCNNIETTKLILQSVGLLVSSLTLFVAIFINQNFAKRKATEDKIKVVNDLVYCLNTTYIKITYGLSAGNMYGGDLKTWTLFEFSKSNFKLENEYLDFPVVFFNSTQIMDLKGFAYNPLMPIEIADELIKFQNSFCEVITYDEMNLISDKMVILESKILNDDEIFNSGNKRIDYYQGNAEAYKTYLNFKSSSQSLITTITNWYSDINIKKVNIRADFNKIK
ncbi:MAG TPA: hypothetical protein PK252_11410 [Bacteroidales bacterium]|nr:hypothetical protein [Bacteroidales bacterium]